MRPWLRRTVKVVLALLLTLVLLIGAAALATQTAWFRNWARGLGERQAGKMLNGELHIGRLDGNLWTGATLSNVRLTQDGRDIVSIERVQVTYDVRNFLRRNVLIPSLTLTRPSVVLIHDERGWRIAQLIKARTNDGKPTQPVRLPSLVVEQGTVAIEDSAPSKNVTWPSRIRGLDATMGLTVGRGLLDLDMQRSAFQGEAPALNVSSLAVHWIDRDGQHQIRDLHLRTARSAVDGTFSYTPGPAGAPSTLGSQFTFSPLDFDELSGILPPLAGRGMLLSGSTEVNGPFNALEVKATLSDPKSGSARADVVFDAASQVRRIRGDVATTRLDLTPVFRSRELASRLTVSSRVNLTFAGPFSFDTLGGTATLQSTGSQIWGYAWDSMTGTVGIDRRRLRIDGRVRAYGTNGTARGTIVPVGGPVRYDLTGRLSGLDLRRLPSQLRVPTLESQFNGTYTVSGVGSRLEASSGFDASSVEGADIGASSTGRFSNVDGTARYGFTGHVAHADVQRFGRALQIASISADDFRSTITGQLMVDGSGTSLETLTIDANAQLEPSTVFKTDIAAATVTAHIADSQLTTSIKGSVTQIDPEQLTGRHDLAGPLAGDVDVQATVTRLGEPFDLGAVSATGTINLKASKVGPLAIDTGRVDASLLNRVATVRAFEAHGPRLDVSASGTVALGDEGQSNLPYTLAMTDLSQIDPLVGRALEGRVQVTGTITGNRTQLGSAGTAIFSGLKIDDSFDALTLDATFDGRLPNLDPGALTASVKVDSTLVTVGGRTIPSVTAQVDYKKPDFRFNATAKETGRDITAAGRLTLLENSREIRFENVSLQAGSATWTLAGGQPFLARYEPNGLLTLVDTLTIDNGGQQISLVGSVAFTEQATGSMDVVVSGADLTSVGSLFLVQRQLAGTLTGDARITGSPSTRNITGNVTLSSGIVDGYTFQSFNALVDYRAEVADVEATLVQSPTARLDITGKVPFSLDKGALTSAPLTLDVTSAGIDLAALEAANLGLSHALGQLVVDVHVTGTGTAPVANGSIAVQQGAFTLDVNGVNYKDVVVDAKLQGEELQVTRLFMHDGDGHVLEGSGKLRVQDRAIRDIDFVVNGDNFAVLDNQYGQLHVDASLNLYGTTTAPHIGGLVRVRSGRLEADAIVDRFASSPYEPTTQPSQAPSQPGTGSQPIAINLTVQVPDNLVIRGRDIRTSNSAIGLGAVNLTAGGDFTIKREDAGAPVLVGTITTVRGTYDFQGRRFTVLRDGTIAFRGNRPIDPALDIAAERVISGIVAHVNLSGTMRSPELTLSSQPPLDQADILSLIVFNQPVNRLGQGQQASLGQRAATLAGGFVVTPIADTLGRALNVDLFELDTSGDEGEGPSVTVGQQVGERLFVKLRQIFGARDVSEFQLEYQLTNFLRLQGSIAEGQTSANRSLTRRVERGGIDLVVTFSY